MRRFWVVAAISSWLLPLHVGAQPMLDIGIKAGLGAATLNHDNRDIRYGASGGFTGVLLHPFGNRFSMGEELDLLYTQRGAETVVDGVTQGESREHYIDLMLALHPEVSLGSLSVYLLLGGSLNVLLSANKDNILGSMEDITDGLRRIDVSVLGGAGVALRFHGQQLGPLRLGSLSLEARHDIGLIDTDAMNGGFKNRTSTLMLGFSFVVAGPSPAGPATG